MKTFYSIYVPLFVCALWYSGHGDAAEIGESEQQVYKTVNKVKLKMYIFNILAMKR